MGGFILFLLAIIIFAVLLIFNAGITILRGIFRIFTGNRYYSQGRGGNPNSGSDERDNNGKANNGEKIFQKDEGEYVDFEEYKDEDHKKN